MGRGGIRHGGGGRCGGGDLLTTAVDVQRRGGTGVAAGWAADRSGGDDRHRWRLGGARRDLVETQKANAEVRRANENTHVRELYTRAIELLGSDTLDVRLGGIYALERIATDSPGDHPTVVEVLSAFVREHTIPGRSGALRRAGRHPTPPSTPSGPETDIQAAVTVLGRLPPPRDGTRADLTGARLAGAQLEKADLSGAALTDVDLTGARLVEAKLTGTTLGRTNLSHADLRKADLSGAALIDADLTLARLIGANLTGARLHLANFARALLHGADLTDASGLEPGDLDTALGDGRTRLQENLRPASWPADGGPS